MIVGEVGALEPESLELIDSGRPLSDVKNGGLDLAFLRLGSCC